MAAAARRPKATSWFWAARPFSLTASIIPVLVGSAMAAGAGFDWTLFALALTGSVAIQIGTNLTDEYADHRRQGASAKFLAPHKVLQRGELSERAVLAGMALSFGYGVAAGLAIVAQVGWPILAVGLVAVAAAYLYSAGPKPIGDVGLGEPAVFLLMGILMVCASYYVQAQNLALAPLLFALPVAFFVTAILHCNNLRDVDEDRTTGKRSLAGRLGRARSEAVYAALLGAGYASLAGAALATAPAHLWALIALATAPWAWGAVGMLRRARARADMNRLMVRTASIHWRVGLLLAAGLALSRLL